MHTPEFSGTSDNFHTFFRIATFLTGLMFSGLLMAEDIWKRSTMTGDWDGRRTTLSERGLSFEAVYTGDITRNVSGGIRQRTAYLDNKDLTLSLDAEKLFNWDGATLFFYVLGNNGGNPSENNVGDTQILSNIESPDTWKLYEAWYEQQFIEDRMSIRIGLYDLNSEFDVIDTAGLFINSSHGIGADFSQSGINGPSIFPVTSLGVRLHGFLTDNIYLQFVALDGVPGDPDRPTGTHIEFNDNDGALLAIESGFISNDAGNSSPYAKLAIGAWRYTSNSVENAAGENIEATKNNGLYILAERSVFHESGNPAQGMALFARYGVAESRINQVDRYFGSGMVYTGLIPGRDQDKLGLAVAVASNSDEYKRSDNAISDEEIAWELSYRVQITPWLAIQPDVQYIINPGTNPSLDNATVFTTRLELIL